MRHVVLIKPRADVSEIDIEACWNAIRGLQDKIDGIERVECGANNSPEGASQGYTIGFIMTFRDAAARDGYLPHPDHQAAVPFVRAIAETVLVFDL